jgi:hypothetical protein
VEAGPRENSPSLLDTIIPSYDKCSRHSIQVHANPAEVYEVARRADLGRPLLVRILMGIRAFPATLSGLFGHGRVTVERMSQKSIGPLSFTLIAETPGQEFVLGIMGRFWTPTGGVVPSSGGQFKQPPPPGLAQGVWNFRVMPSGAGTVLSTETRVRCSDPATRRQFGRYWLVIRLGSGLIRRSMLRQIRLEAERHAATSHESGTSRPRNSHLP